MRVERGRPDTGSAGGALPHTEIDMQLSGRRALVPLTGARFLAALWVVLYHSLKDFGFAAWFQRPSQSAPGALVRLVVLQGPLAVDFFFLLSGFILAYTYLAPDGRLRGGKRTFWIARLARIYPVYLLGIALGLITYLQDGHAPSSAALATTTHLLLVQTWTPAAVPLDLNPPAWSLAAEALFYALFPFLLPLCARLGKRALLVAAGAAWALDALLLVSLAALAAHVGFATDPTWGFFVAFNPLVKLPEFLLGLVLGLSFVRAARVEQAGAKTAQARVARLALHDVGAAGLVAALGALCVLAPRIMALPVPSVLTLCAIPLMAALIYLLAFQSGLLARALSVTVVAWLGEISYGVYILHWPLWSLWHRYVLGTLPFASGSIWSLLAYLLVLVTAAGLSFQYLEAPARRAIRARWGKAQPRAADGHSAKVGGQADVAASGARRPWHTESAPCAEEGA